MIGQLKQLGYTVTEWRDVGRGRSILAIT